MPAKVLYIGVSDEERESFAAVLDGHEILMAENSEEAACNLQDLHDTALVLLDMVEYKRDAVNVLKAITPRGLRIRTRTVIFTESGYLGSEISGLLRNGCDRMQGYLVIRPLDEAAALEMLKVSVGINFDCRSFSCR